eukprot:1155604-Pelagomonas_calceolata.AAC.1
MCVCCATTLLSPAASARAVRVHPGRCLRSVLQFPAYICSAGPGCPCQNSVLQLPAYVCSAGPDAPVPKQLSAYICTAGPGCPMPKQCTAATSLRM